MRESIRTEIQPAIGSVKDTTSGTGRASKGWRRPFLLVSSLLVVAMVLGSVFWLAQQYAIAAESRRAADRLTLYLSTLVSALEEHQHLPFILARDPSVIAGTDRSENKELNRRLESFTDEAGVDAIYLMDRQGLTIAASNWSEPKTFLGNNYGFRPYFKSALTGLRGVFFAIGATTQEPGFFIAEPVYSGPGLIAGVIALKVDLTSLTRAWREGGETLLAVDPRGVAILASNPDWTYRTLEPLSDDVREEIAGERQFGNEPLEPLDISGGADEVTIDGVRYLQSVGPVGHLGWNLHYLTPFDRINGQAWQAVLLTAAVLLLASVAFLLVRTQRIRTALFASQQQRRGLQQLNRRLEAEIDERRAAEQRLELAQSELQKVSKMAALGQLSASVTHELGQPIAAMRNYLATADLPGSRIDGEARELVDHLNGIAARMEHITGQLRFFARAQPNKLSRFDLRDVVAPVLDLMKPDLSAAGVGWSQQLGDDPVWVFGDALRIEQVLVNLIRNALDAVSGNENPQISLRLTGNGDLARLSVADNGPGLDDEALERAEDPFFTTKPSGTSMGLGLSISASILKEHEGQMEISNAPEGGAIFTMTMPVFGEARQQ